MKLGFVGVVVNTPRVRQKINQEQLFLVAALRF